MRLREPLVHDAVGTTNPTTVTTTLAELLDGPVVHNRPFSTYHALVPVHFVIRWTEQYREARMLGEGSYVEVPSLDLRGPDGVYWAVPPRSPGHVCALEPIAALVESARRSSGQPR
ncbi:hypothetical protein [Streptomyces sp. NPDC047123]|uniref:hypothetical protein n=1 Tax=Streptomyces sp. NPDC047123 TaxID=3155622 RepID=UPI0033DE3596